MNEFIDVTDIQYGDDRQLSYKELLSLFNLDYKSHTNRSRTINNKIKPYFIVEEVKNDLGRVLYYKIVGKISDPINIKVGRPIEYKEEKDYLLLAMMSDALKNRIGTYNINRVQKSGTAIAASFGLLNKVNINLFDSDSYEYSFIRKNYKLFNILINSLYSKKKNLYNYINNNDYIDMNKSLMLKKEENRQIDIIRLDDYYDDMEDILKFDYNEYIISYCINRKRNKIFEMQRDNEPENVIDNFRDKKFTDFNIYNSKCENELFQKDVEEHFLSLYKQYKPVNYNYVCVRNLIVNNNDYLNTLLHTIIDKKKVYYYKKKLNDDIINDLSSTYLKKYCNNIENNNYNKYKELLEICIRI